MPRWIRRSIAAALTATLLITGAGTAQAAAGPSGVRARGAILVDAASGKTKWSRAASTPRPIASITKVMTALVVLQQGGLDRTVRIKPKYVSYARTRGGTKAKLVAGDRLTVRQLLYGLMLPSGCDAAYALADTYGPGWPKFVTKMNRTARKLGMTKTHYANFDGLPWPSQTSTRSTPRDLVKLARKAMQSAEFRKIVATRTYRLPRTRTHHPYKLTNTNRLIGSYKGMTGIKTGFTNGAGYSLLFSATRNGRTYIGVVLNSSKTTEKSRFTDTVKLLNWAYRTTTVTQLPPIPTGTDPD